MGEEKNWFHQFSSLIDQNIRGVQYGIYSVAGLGLILALRSVRPFAKFSFPSDIPQHFIAKKIPLTAKVNMIQPATSLEANPLLLVDHHPIIALTNKSKNDGLPLEISSVKITGNGFLWLQSMLSNQEITFIPLKTSKDRVFSVVFNKQQNVGLHLVKIGFGTVSPIDVSLEKDKYYLKYYKKLLSEEEKAERRGTGLWAGCKVPIYKSVVNKFKNFISFSV